MLTKEQKQIITFLEGVPFFSEISEESLIHLFEGSTDELFKKNEAIFKKEHT